MKRLEILILSYSVKLKSITKIEAQKLGTYTKLPNDIPIPVSTGRNTRTASEINDLWFTVARGSEDCSYKAMRRNLYEEALFKCEDERFELDVAINNFTSCEEYLTAIHQKATRAAEQGEIYEIDERAFKSPKLKIIAKVYGESANIVMSKLESDPVQAIPIVLNRVIQQKQTLLYKKAEQNKIWKETCEKNFYKSLDLKVFYFKQLERKHINLKGNL